MYETRKTQKIFDVKSFINEKKWYNLMYNLTNVLKCGNEKKTYTMEKKIYNRFPCVLRSKLEDGVFTFPEGTRFEYDAFLAYRAVERKESDFAPVTVNDFKSYIELGKKTPRGYNGDPSKDPSFYSASLFLDKKIVEQVMRFPNPKLKMAKGYVNCEYGPEYTKDKHIDWWLYENVELEGFVLVEGDIYE